MTGLHIVKKRLRHGPRFYVYAWRGGPCIHTQDGSRPVIDREILGKALDAHREPTDHGNIAFLIREYRASPEFTTRRPATRRDYDLSLDRIEAKFGKAALQAFEDRRMRRDIIAWRNEWQAQPRTADKLTVMLSSLLQWGVHGGYLTINVAHGIKHLHHVNKADKIWEARHFEAMPSKGPLADAITLAKLTGLRLSDLVALDWSHVGPSAITIRTQKRGSVASIPIINELKAWLDGRARTDGPVLLNSRRAGWSPDGLKTAFQRAKPEGFDRTFHDLRGTYATWLATKGLTDQEIARIVGWSAKRIGDLRARYVDEERVVISLVERLSA